MSKRVAVVFVHGFTGGPETWKNSTGTAFADILANDAKLAEDFDFFTFDYFTKATAIFQSLPVQKILTKIPFVKGWFGIEGKVRSNRPLAKLSEELSSYLAIDLGEYEEVILVAHSMGGLIAKGTILNREHGYGPTPTGFVSVAVPHKGALSAVLFCGLNVNASELTPLSEYNDGLNERWAEMKDKLPPCLYLIAQYDEFVPSVSALPFSVPQKNKATVPHDHTSIAKPSDKNDRAYLAVKRFLTDLQYQRQMKSLASSAATMQTPAYEKEIFVLKMLVTGIGNHGIKDAKNCFFNAEIVSKSANKIDLEEIKLLQSKVLSLYQQKYNECSECQMSSNQIFAAVHKVIVDQDSAALKSSVEYFNFLHKKGLLHQLANQLGDDVIWADDTDFEKIKAALTQ